MCENFFDSRILSCIVNSEALKFGDFMPTQIAGIILRAKDKHLTAKFYAELGLTTDEHGHGGPKHYEMLPLSLKYAVEIYQQSSRFAGDALMLEVESISQELAVAAMFNIKPKSDEKNNDDMKFIYITDPDGRDVMLIEMK